MKNAGTTRMFYYAQALASNEIKVYLTTCSSSPLNNNSFKEVYPNVFALEKNTKTKSFLGTIKFVKQLLDFSEKTADKLVYIFYPSPLIYLELVALFYLKLLKKRTVFYEFNEVRKYSSTFLHEKSIKRPIYSIKKTIYKTVFTILEYFLKYYDGLICISTSIETYGNFFNPSTIRIPILTNPNLKKEFSNEIYSQKKMFNIGFSGSIQPDKENLINFLEVLHKLKENKYNFSFNLCGTVKKKHKDIVFNRAPKELNLNENIKYYGNLNSKELSTFLSQQQLLVIPRGFTLQNNYGFSTKLSDYLDHSKVILVTDISDNKLYIKNGINGFIVPTDNNDKMYDTLTYIIDDYDNIFDEIQIKAHETSKHCFHFENFSEKLDLFLFKK